MRVKIVFFFLVQVSGICYFESSTALCAVCWVDGEPGNPRECEDGIRIDWLSALPEELQAKQEYRLSYTLRVNSGSVPFDAVAVADGSRYHVTHSNIHSCWVDAGACTPFVQNSPGLATHTPELNANFTELLERDRLGFTHSATFDAQIRLHEAAAYTIIAHVRFFVRDESELRRIDAAIAISRNVLAFNPVTEAEYGLSLIHFLSGILGCLVLVLSAALSYYTKCYRRLTLRHHVIRNPSVADNDLGKWVHKWIGPYKQQLLTSSETSRASLHLVGNSSFLVNATPFRVFVTAGSSVAHHRSSRGDIADASFEVSLNADSWCHLDWPVPEQLEIRLQNEARSDATWNGICTINTQDLHRGNGDENKQVCYENQTFRCRLPDSDGQVMGDLKLTKGPDSTFLLSWSLPHVQRGVPLKELKHWLDEVVNSPGTWQCFERAGARVAKAAGSKHRNMYDACEHLLMKTVALLDASYAEIRTDCGPADLFISHVWAETALNTHAAIERLITKYETAAAADKSMTVARFRRSRSVESMDKDDGTPVRAYFCVLCNNQSRIKYELGPSTENSPFAEVLCTPLCKSVALISPTKALERKWCNYEFSLAAYMGKEIFMLTREGIVQDGEVSPKTLHLVSMKLAMLHCVNAKCSNPADSVAIDEAVNRMGGYDVLDRILRQTFQNAVRDAQHWLTEAHDALASPTAAGRFESL